MKPSFQLCLYYIQSHVGFLKKHLNNTIAKKTNLLQMIFFSFEFL